MNCESNSELINYLLKNGWAIIENDDIVVLFEKDHINLELSYDRSEFSECCPICNIWNSNYYFSGKFMGYVSSVEELQDKIKMFMDAEITMEYYDGYKK